MDPLQRIAVAGAAAAILLGAVVLAQMAHADSWAEATRILWADLDKDPLPRGAYRDIRVRAQPEGRDWAQWAPSRRGDPLTADEVGRVLDQGYFPMDVHAQEVLLRLPGSARVAISTLEPPAITEDGILWRESSAWSESRSYGVPLDPPTEPILAPEPGRGKLMAAGLLMLMFLHQKRRLRRL